MKFVRNQTVEYIGPLGRCVTKVVYACLDCETHKPEYLIEHKDGNEKGSVPLICISMKQSNRKKVYQRYLKPEKKYWWVADESELQLTEEHARMIIVREMKYELSTTEI